MLDDYPRGYDPANRLIQGSSIVSFTYDAAGRRTSLTLPNGVLVEYAYDAASRLTSITYKQGGTTVLGDLTYEYDKNGNRTKIGGSFARTGIPPAVSSTAYNAANHQTTFDNKTLTYDNNGNLQTITDPGGTTTYTWNARNQLIGISGPTVTASFVYDGLGRREKKTVNGNLTEFLYDGVNPVQETSGAAVLANVLPGSRIDEFLARNDVVSGGNSYFLVDAIASSLALTDATGTVQTEYSYEPFGKTTVTGASNTNPYQYTGRENDSVELYYYRARYYHPRLQRFVSEDPLRVRGGDVNLYVYAHNSPMVYRDPTGNFGTGTIGRWILKYIIKKIGSKALNKLIDKYIEPNPIMPDEEEQQRLDEYRQRHAPQTPSEPPPSGEPTSPGPPPPRPPLPPKSNPTPPVPPEPAPEPLPDGPDDDDCAWDGTSCGPVAS